MNMSSSMTRRSAFALTGALSLAGVLAACSPSSSSSSSEDKLQAIKDAGTIRIGMEGTFRPWGYHDEKTNELVGMEKEIGDLIAADLGVEAEYIETQWDSLIAGVDSDRYDIVINNVAPTEERQQKYDFSTTYVASKGKVAVKKDSELQKVEDIAGHTAASSETSNFRTLLEGQGATIVTVTGFDEAIEQVLSGRVDCCGNDAVTFAAYDQEHPNADYRLLEGELGDASESAILMPKGQDALKNAINDSLKKHTDNGDLKAIYEKYVGMDLTPKA
ncbi:transporter substrate-binding domain-containing protein [Rothia aerolata]|uniref:Amino acid ABC transporter substrate-binding protein n=1 Tax=Rothia aerolata TaxID=1812262 RepID=A0A917MUD4_9MICC|nr:transporter substrate-binding domain-containing protein [Rothia aerolata]GGH64672.1 amino acid ABC transporter substrate-binding protein [Rothia aerolata]